MQSIESPSQKLGPWAVISLLKFICNPRGAAAISSTCIKSMKILTTERQLKQNKKGGYLQPTGGKVHARQTSWLPNTSQFLVQVPHEATTLENTLASQHICPQNIVLPTHHQKTLQQFKTQSHTPTNPERVCYSDSKDLKGTRSFFSLSLTSGENKNKNKPTNKTPWTLKAKVNLLFGAR